MAGGRTGLRYFRYSLNGGSTWTQIGGTGSIGTLDLGIVGKGSLFGGAQGIQFSFDWVDTSIGITSDPLNIDACSSAGAGIEAYNNGDVAYPTVTIDTTVQGGDDLYVGAAGTVDGVSGGIYRFYIRGWAQDPDTSEIFLTGTREITLTVSGSPLNLNPSSGTIVDSGGSGPNTGSFFTSTQLSILNGAGPYTISAANLPTGMGISAIAGGTPLSTITTPNTAFYVVGQPDSAGTYSSISFTVTDNSPVTPIQVTCSSYTLVVTAAGGGSLTVTKTSQTPAILKQGQTMSMVFTASGGDGTYTYTTNSSLPDGVTLVTQNNTGILSGIPIEATDKVWSNIRITATDTSAHTGYLDTTFEILPAVWFETLQSNANAAQNLFPDCTIGSSYGSHAIVARGGAGTTYKIYFNSSNFAQDSYLPGQTGISGLSIQEAVINEGMSAYVAGDTLTIAGTPTGYASNPRYFYYRITAATTNSGTVSTSTGDGYPAYYDLVNISGSSQLTITESGLQSLYQAEDTATVATYSVSGPGTGTFTWVLVPRVGSPAGLFELNSTTGTSVTVKFNGVANPTRWGPFSYDLNVSRTSGETGTKILSYTINGEIHYTGTFPATFAQNLDITPFSLVFSGGNNTSFAAVVSQTSLPPWLSYTQSGTGLNTYTFTGKPTVAAGSYTATLTIKELSSGVQTTFSFNYAVTGGDILINPYGGLALCPRVPDPTGPEGGDPSVTKPTAIVGAICSNGTYTITPTAGTFNHAGPYVSGEEVIWTAPNNNATTYTLTYTSVVDGAVTVNQVITVSGATVQLGQTTFSPAGLTKMYQGTQKTFTPILPYTGCATPANIGTWAASPAYTNGITLSNYWGQSLTVTAPTPIDTAKAAVVVYTPVENPEYDRGYVGIILLPGTEGAFQFTTSDILPTGTKGSPYDQTIGHTGATGTVHWLLVAPDNVLPAGLSFDYSTGRIYGTPTVDTPHAYIAVAAYDSASPAKWEAKVFKLVILPNAAGTPTLTNVQPNTGVHAGGTLLMVNGANLASSDQLVFTDPSNGTFFRYGSGYNYAGVPSSFQCYTPPWPGVGPTPVSLSVSRSGVSYSIKPNGYTFTDAGAGLSITSITPTSVNVGHGSNLSVTINGTGFDNSCTVDYNPNTVAHQGYVGGLTVTAYTGTTLTVTLPKMYYADSTYVGSPIFKVTRASETPAGVTTSLPGWFQVLPITLQILTTQATFVAGYKGSGYGPVFAEAAGGTPGTSGYRWSLKLGDSLPNGIYLYDYGASGYVYGGFSGTVQSDAISKNFTLRVVDEVAAVAEKPFTINISGGGSPVITTSSLPNATIGTAYSTTLLVSDGVSPYTWSIVSGVIPDGLSLTPSTGVISGTPNNQTAPSNWNFTVQVTDDNNLTATKSLTMALYPASSSVTITGISPVFGPLSGGTVVTITGTGFQNNCAVKFGATSATSVTFVSATQIKAVAPPKAVAGSVNITVTNTDGGNASYSSYEYRNIQTPIITGLDKRDGPFVGGQAVRLYGQNFLGTTWVRFYDANDSAGDATIVSIDAASDPNTIDITTPNGFQFSPDGGATKLEVNIYANNAQGVGSITNVENWYTYRPPPIITAIVPNAGPTTGGQAVYILGKNFFQRGDSFKPRVFIGNVEVSAENIKLVEE